MMNIITISRKLAQKDDLVIIPRREYEALLRRKQVEEFTPTIAQKKALARAENGLRKGKTLSYNELVKKLGIRNQP